MLLGHHEVEEVKVSVVESQDGHTNQLTSNHITYSQDGFYHLARFLVESVCSVSALQDLELIKTEHFNLADLDLSTLDLKLDKALSFLKFPDWWSILGPETESEHPEPRESLLHFCARLGLSQVANRLLHKPGSEAALKLPNHKGHLPKDIALDHGHNSLAELLSEYQLQSLLPVMQCWKTGNGNTLYTQTTGEVSLTSNLHTHNRTIEEDIIVLEEVLKQKENKDVNQSRPWQTDWPVNISTNTDSDIETQDSTLDDKYHAVCEKTKELSGLISASDYHDNVFTDPNLDARHDEATMSEEGDVTMGTERLSGLQNSEDEMEGIYEGSLSALHEYNEHLHRIREKSTVFSRILEQDLRKENLARFSSSCPSLDINSRNSPLPVIDEAELCKSMVDLAEDSNAPENTAASTSSFYSGDVFSSGPDITDTHDNVHIVVDGVTTTGSSDLGAEEYDQFLKEYYGGNHPQVRRRSCSPLPSQTANHRTDKPSMLIHASKSSSTSLMPGEEDTDDDSFRSREDVSGSDGNLSTDGYRRPVHSTGDIDNQPTAQRKRDVVGDDDGRGQVNKARYSADIEHMMRQSQENHSGTSLDKMSVSTHSTSSTGEDNSGLLGMPHGKITKALSMSSIPAATHTDKHRGTSYKDKHPSNFTDTSNASSSKSKDKDEKKRKPSVFSRFHSSYRIKRNKDKEGKESKSKSSSHRYVSVSFSNATTCDVCHKPLTNKPALRCQICLVNVHENSCKEHITACDKFKSKSQVPRQSSAESESIPSGQDGSTTPGVSMLRTSYSFNKGSTASRPQTYTGAATTPVPIPSGPIQADVAQLQMASAQAQRRSLPTPSRVIVEEGETDASSRQVLGHQSNFSDSISRSTESLDEVDSVAQEVRYNDVELGSLMAEEPENWSETVDKKVLKKMNPKDIKRQDTIWELIQTERQYCKRLKTLQIYFRDALRKELNMNNQWLESMFPQIDDLIHIHMSFLRQLQELQTKRPDRFVDEIGHVLDEQFSGESSDHMKSTYGTFCSRHLEAVQIYKDLFAKDRNFQKFIKSRNRFTLCRRREIPDFFLLVTIRPTKYPIMIEAVIKSTKDKKDRENLVSALNGSKDVLQNVNEQVAAAELAMKLKDIYNRLDNRSFALHRGKKFRKSDLLNGSRRLLHEGMIGWKNARGKSVDVLGVLLTDALFFLQENNQKYSFFSQDNKYGVVSLFKLLVREKCDTRDTKGIYLISQNKVNPEMYEIVFNSTVDMKKWAEVLKTAVENCPEEENEEPTEEDKEARRHEERSAKAQEIIEALNQKDNEIRQCCEAKNKLMDELLSLYSDDHHHSRPSSREVDDVALANTGLLQDKLNEVSSRLTNMLQVQSTHLSRSVSSVGEHSSNTFTAVPIPKRAETFAGFDNNHEHKLVKKTACIDQSDSFIDSPNTSIYKDKDASDPDLSQYVDAPSSLPKHGYDSGSESGRGSSPSAYSTGAVISPDSTPSIISQDQNNIAYVLKTLTTIVHLTSNQGTAVETLRAQLNDATARLNKLTADVHEKKSGYKHNQLEELRNLQGVIQKEKEDWEIKKAREKSSLDEERRELEETKEQLNKYEAEIKQQREKLHNEKQVLQKQMDLLRKSGQLPSGTSSSDLSVDSADKVQSEFVPGHKRSASAESFNSSPGENKKQPSKESNFRPEQKSVIKLQSFSYGSNNQNLPLHLLSATNEQKMGSKNVQQLQSSASSISSSSLQQTGLKSGSAGNQSSPSLNQESGSHLNISQIGHSSSTGQMSSRGQQANQYGSTTTAPIGSFSSNRPKPSSKAGLSGVLKLAEKKGKSSSQLAEKSGGGGQEQQRPKSGTSAGRNPNVSHKPQKSDSDVIYF